MMSSACLIACQGSAQLVTAMVAAGIRPTDGATDIRPFDVLVHDLRTPAGQDAEFVRVLEQVARLGCGCRSVRYIAPADVSALQTNREQLGLDAAGRAFAARLGLDDVAELYLGQNAVLLNEALRCGYRHVRRIGYGDSVGMNFTPRYFAPERTPTRARQQPLRALRSAVGRAARRVLPRRTEDRPEDPGFDGHRLLLPNLFDERLSTYEATDPAAFEDLFTACVGLQPAQLRERYAVLRADALRASSTVVLLSTNFSEAGKMALEDEIAAYAGFVSALAVGSQALLIIKPHPRDSRTKIERLREALVSRFARIEVLDDPFSFYLPFEVIYADCFRGWPDAAPPLVLAGFSTAVLPLEYLYGAHCVIGFGGDVVRRRIAPEWREHRLRHEQDLQSATALVRHNRARPLALREWPRP